jgi:REP element-mobilizing transposase RayT
MQGHKALRKGRFSQEYNIYHVTVVTCQRQHIFSSFGTASTLAKILSSPSVLKTSSISAWVIMPDHWHAIVQVGRYDSLSKVVGRIKAISTRVIHNERLWEGDIWSKAFHDRALRSESELLPLARYIVANPLRAGLTQKAGSYPFWNAIWL